MSDAASTAGKGFAAQPNSNQSHFDILDYLHYLQPDGGSETKIDRSFFCPLCGSKNFKVNLKNAKYGAFGCHCTDSDASKQKLKKWFIEQEDGRAHV